MSGEHEYATIAAELLATRKQEARTRSPDRQQGIAIVANAMTERARRVARVRAAKLGALLVAAAGIALVGGWLGARAPARATATCVGPACAGPPVRSVVGTVAGRPFEPGQSIMAGRGQATVVEFGPVTRIALDELSELEYRQADRTQRFGLLSGAVHLKVAKLKAGQRFLVETVDTQVEVRGTEFDVALAKAGDGCAAPRTRISVEEGVVEVRFRGKTSRVRAGESWPATCDEPLAPVVPASPAKVSAAPAPARVSALRAPAKPKVSQPALNAAPAKSEPAATPAAAPVSKANVEPAAALASLLAEQNNLYAEAAALHRSGRLADALSAYERLLARFPGGPLAESASVGRLRILAKSERTRAAEEARRYLARYPHGIASAEAQALLSGP